MPEEQVPAAHSPLPARFRAPGTRLRSGSPAPHIHPCERPKRLPGCGHVYRGRHGARPYILFYSCCKHEHPRALRLVSGNARMRTQAYSSLWSPELQCHWMSNQPSLLCLLRAPPPHGQFLSGAFPGSACQGQAVPLHGCRRACMVAGKSCCWCLRSSVLRRQEFSSPATPGMVAPISQGAGSCQVNRGRQC